MRSGFRHCIQAPPTYHPKRLFAAGEIGGVYVARDLSTLVSTAAGSTPDVALNGVAGKWLDVSGQGNHATQSTSAARPQLSARYNVFLSSENLIGSGWTSVSTTNSTATKLIANASAGLSSAYRIQQITKPTLSVVYDFRVAAAPAEFNSILLMLYGGAGTLSQVKINLSTGAVIGSISNTGGFTLTQLTITSAASGYVITGRGTTTATNLLALRLYPADTVATTGDGTSGVTVTSVDLRLADGFVRVPPYQRVGSSASDYDSAGFPLHLAFDATDDALVATYPSSLGSACTVAVGQAAGAPLILTNQTIDTTYTLNAAVAQRVTGLVVINRVLSAMETALVTKFLQSLS